jgi:hypothetical protein
VGSIELPYGCDSWRSCLFAVLNRVHYDPLLLCRPRYFSSQRTSLRTLGFSNVTTKPCHLILPRTTFSPVHTFTTYFPNINFNNIPPPSYVQAPGQLSRYNIGLRAGGPGFDSRQGQKIPIFLYTASRPGPPASYPMGTGGKAAGA